MNINNTKVTPDLQKFIDFADDNYGFWAEFSIPDNADSFMKPWVGDHPNFEAINKAFIVLGVADGTGGYFSFWDDNTGKSLDEMPIVILGSEGELPLVASNFKDLMRLMTTGDEMSTYESEVWVSAEDVGIYNKKYALWLKDEFGLETIKTVKEANGIIAEAIRLHGEAFEVWVQANLDPNYVIAERTLEDEEDDDDEVMDVKSLIRMASKAALTDDFEEASKYYTKALSIEPDNSDVYEDWGLHLSNYGQRNGDREKLIQAAEKYEKLLELKPKSHHARLYHNIGLIQLEIGKSEKRLAENKELIMTPMLKSEELKKGESAYNLACYFSLLNDLENAFKWFEMCVSKKSTARSHIERDSDLKNLRGDSRFLELLDKYMPKRKKKNL